VQVRAVGLRIGAAVMPEKNLFDEGNKPAASRIYTLGTIM
jgi:hypothetical protein